MKEEQILRRLRKQDPKGLEAAIDTYGAYVSAVAWNILSQTMTVPDAEEVVSDVFLALWEKAETVQSGKLRPWLAAVARNLARHKLRQLGKELPLEEDMLAVSDGSTPLDVLISEEERQAVRGCVEALGEPDREIFLRHYYYIQSVRDISRDMDMKESTIKSRLKRGREKLKKMLEDWRAE